MMNDRRRDNFILRKRIAELISLIFSAPLVAFFAFLVLLRGLYRLSADARLDHTHIWDAGSAHVSLLPVETRRDSGHLRFTEREQKHNLCRSDVQLRSRKRCVAHSGSA